MAKACARTSVLLESGLERRRRKTTNRRLVCSGTSNKLLDVRRKQRLCYPPCPFSLTLRVAVSAHVNAAVGHLLVSINGVNTKQMKPFTVNINFIAKRQNASRWRSAGEYNLPVLPRVGEHFVLTENEEMSLYKIVGVFHTVPFAGLTEVFAVYDGTLSEVQNRMLSL